jgi:hypothetical protein
LKTNGIHITLLTEFILEMIEILTSERYLCDLLQNGPHRVIDGSLIVNNALLSVSDVFWGLFMVGRRVGKWLQSGA